MKHTLSVLVLNKPGVLARISGLLSRRMFNIESITAGYSEEPNITRITIVVQGDDLVLEQVINQLSKLIDVIKIKELPMEETIARELALIKVRALPEKRADIVNIVNIFRANIVDVNRETMVIELTGDEDKINALCEVLTDHGIVEIVRTGKVALNRGPRPAKEL
ncbi:MULTISPECIES: acetolactate synthase small subunit [Carboxydothermus]|uniref:Acetolactate synthase small subunit n=3 Tax=Carboxydothermus TaxID=129957 RepID=Q3ABR2_CARHZ|nr:MULTISPECIES: acetolactate synthase small subunit [Carboxydothermus]ABB15639.1 acetolactate synthase, small subunit [Carboxydothermus hydrogenoformans Z-2901]NYE58359.1 acetolactate synthase-1/3 small subunit [Carboxydothermus ferrireducens DSM 11255]GAV25100.1 acetolactate synthase small subunit [Carboxydothermus islandicus]